MSAHSPRQSLARLTAQHTAIHTTHRRAHKTYSYACIYCHSACYGVSKRLARLLRVLVLLHQLLELRRFGQRIVRHLHDLTMYLAAVLHTSHAALADTVAYGVCQSLGHATSEQLTSDETAYADTTSHAGQ